MMHPWLACRTLESRASRQLSSARVAGGACTLHGQRKPARLRATSKVKWGQYYDTASARITTHDSLDSAVTWLHVERRSFELVGRLIYSYLYGSNACGSDVEPRPQSSYPPSAWSASLTTLRCWHHKKSQAARPRQQACVRVCGQIAAAQSKASQPHTKCSHPVHFNLTSWQMTVPHIS